MCTVWLNVLRATRYSIGDWSVPFFREISSALLIFRPGMDKKENPSKAPAEELAELAELEELEEQTQIPELTLVNSLFSVNSSRWTFSVNILLFLVNGLLWTVNSLLWTVNAWGSCPPNNNNKKKKKNNNSDKT